MAQLAPVAEVILKIGVRPNDYVRLSREISAELPERFMLATLVTQF